ncbi:TatD family hydrolase [Weissella viridescens]|jgi:TatD DNase family protein|uniref:Mg-dependent DNase n=1 Tax=Weissella viridescens TaxID=1629 RepID=A0A0R2H804_WEIVI|nr:TatD family hydrolase [Weissella viridescens]KRN45764.1 Mg-dependent DNase [Weissella viridescens]MBX4173483.1 TatD family hydrolase [Weissella viridescens]MCB6840800.1 TatD family hydrolase [Weissella viridescens]MCB6847533.1 TatD family hydrolase [Weissella viridescens]QOD86037.1 TatD family hydrolase [Weissella viridescens]
MAIYDPSKRPEAAYDSHTHLNETEFSEDVPAYWARAREYRIMEMNVVGYNHVGNAQAIEIAHELEGVHAIVGFQPEDVNEVNEAEMAILRDQLNDDTVVGLGEMGLDYHWEDNPAPEVQKAAFAAQLDLARETHLPVTVHARDAFDDVYDMLKAHHVEEFGGVMHSFTGDAKEVQRFLDLGMYIGFSGMVTFKKSEDIKAALQVVPLDRILVETDAPFLAPTPMRGKMNEPMFTHYTLENMAEQLGMTYNEIAKITTDNAHRLWLDK